MSKRKHGEPFQDFLAPESPPNSILDPEAALRKIQDLDVSFIQSALASAYASYPEIRRAVDIEHYRVDKVRMARNAAAMAAQRQSDMEAGRAPSHISPMTYAGAMSLVSSANAPASTNHNGTPTTSRKRRSVNGYKYNTPTAVAKREIKRLRAAHLPVVCSHCGNIEPDGNTRRTRWQVPNGGDGLLCPECRRTNWRQGGGDEYSDENEENDEPHENGINGENRVSANCIDSDKTKNSAEVQNSAKRENGQRRESGGYVKDNLKGIFDDYEETEKEDI